MIVYDIVVVRGRGIKIVKKGKKTGLYAELNLNLSEEVYVGFSLRVFDESVGLPRIVAEEEDWRLIAIHPSFEHLGSRMVVHLNRWDNSYTQITYNMGSGINRDKAWYIGYQRLPYTLRQKTQSLMLRGVGGKRFGFFTALGIVQKS